MKKTVKYALLLLFIFMNANLSRAVTFSRMPAGEGFPQTNISGLAQDKTGDIWMTSADGGIYRYDGTKVQTIDSDIKVSGLFVDDEGRVFIGTSSKVYLFEELRGLTLVSAKSGFRDAVSTPDGDVFFVSHRRLSVLRSGTDSLKVIAGSDRTFFRSVEYLGGNIYVGDSDAGLSRLDPSSFKMEKIAAFSEDVCCLAGQDSNLLWVSDYGHGLSCYDLSSGKVVKTFCKANGLSSDIVQSLCFENDSTLWLGTYAGVNIVNLNDFSVSVSGYKFFDENSLSHDSVKTLFRDFQGGMWVGTFFGGVCYYHQSRNRFKVLKEGYGPAYLNDAVVSCICEGPDGTLWIGTNNGGVNEYDRARGTFKYYSFNHFGKASDDVKAFLCLPDDRYVLVGLFRGGLNILDRRTGRVRHLNSPRDVINIEKLDDDMLILNSYDNVYLYSLSSNQYHEIQGRQLSYPRFKQSRKIPGVKIASELKQAKDVIWYGTDNGLYKYNRSDSSFVHYSTADGLSCDYFNPGAACIGRDGTMYFGGVGGVTYFYPLQFSSEPVCPAPIIRSVINDSESLDFSGPIRLKHSQNRLAFNFSVPDYISAGTNEFEYMLEGFEKDWNSSGHKNSAYYPNLPAGVFHFRVRVSRGNAEWVECAFHPRIRVFRPWYLSAIGMTLELLLAFFILFVVLHSIDRRKEAEHALALSRMEEKYQRDISKLKALKLVNTQIRIDKKSHPVIDDLSRQNELFITRAMSVVEANIANENFSTELLAQKLSMSRASLHTRIKEATGQSALEFIRKIRFSEACRLLEEGKLTISEVGYKIGIKSPSYFSSSFKKVVGCLPKEYAVRQNLKRLDKI